MRMTSPNCVVYLIGLANYGERRACDEACGAGYVLQRAMQERGYHCDIITPSLIPIKPGVQRTHNTYDAGQLARLYRPS